MIVLFSDFGLAGPYTGQVMAVLHQTAPDAPVISLFADAPSARPKPSAYLLAAYGAWFPAGTVLLCVVDPGVGSTRRAVVAEAGERLYVGPDNGLFDIAMRR
ncbi:MAG TPA: SAM-dependent chlorinase/fluorinase, partial [Stellaceae bacterium]|nr:SAM-dependent chlorinase/fluorinase [Stellaceae bacterium]